MNRARRERRTFNKALKRQEVFLCDSGFVEFNLQFRRIRRQKRLQKFLISVNLNVKE